MRVTSPTVETFTSRPCYAPRPMTAPERIPAFPSFRLPHPAAPGHLVHRPAPRPRGRDPDAQETKKSSPPGPLLPRRGHPGPRGFRRRLPRPVPNGPEERRLHHRVRRRPVHGRDGQNPESDPESRTAGLRGRLLARGLLPARRVPGLARGAPRRRVADLHQLLGRGEGALGHHRHLVERREDRPLRFRRTRRSSSRRTVTSARSCRRR